MKDIELDLGKINIIIGPQAQGKSILAKPFFLYKLLTLHERTIAGDKNSSEFMLNRSKEFKAIFPSYSQKKLQTF